MDLKAGCEQEKGLRRWLCEATVHIPLPPIEVDVPVVGIEVITLDGLACGGVSLGPISSSVDLSASKQRKADGGGVTRLEACAGLLRRSGVAVSPSDRPLSASVLAAASQRVVWHAHDTW